MRYSQVLSDWLARDPESKAHLQEVGWQVMAGGMKQNLTAGLVAQIIPGTDVAVDGLRHPIDYEFHRDLLLSSFRLLYIDSPLKDRWQHLKGRGRYATLEAFEAADSHPVEQKIELLLANADLVIQNRGSLQDLYAAMDNAILSFRKEDSK